MPSSISVQSLKQRERLASLILSRDTYPVWYTLEQTRKVTHFFDLFFPWSVPGPIICVVVGELNSEFVGIQMSLDGTMMPTIAFTVEQSLCLRYLHHYGVVSVRLLHFLNSCEHSESNVHDVRLAVDVAKRLNECWIRWASFVYQNMTEKFHDPNC